MKILSLNVWGCRVPAVFEFIKGQSSSVDVFCFQEVLKGGTGVTDKGEIKDSFERINEILIDYDGYFLEYGDGGYFSQKVSLLDFQYGLACFVRKEIKHENLGGVRLYDFERKWGDHDGDLAAGLLQSVKINNYTLFNIHGLWQEGSEKKDTDARFEQLKIINNFIEKYDNKIICGDLNVRPETVFLKSFKENHQDLMHNFNIETTRSSLYKKDLKHADYIFTDKSVLVHDCYTEDVEVSDHLPVIVDTKD